MNAQTFGPTFAPYAAANNVILIVPQANGSWENSGTIGSDPSSDDQYTRNGKVMKFIKGLVGKATEAKSATFVDEMAAGEHTFGQAYPGRWVDEGKEG